VCPYDFPGSCVVNLFNHRVSFSGLLACVSSDELP
jgi:hypothetical protein